ncbi:MAG: Rne/Rng family ribonuclease [Bacteroidales bacterium]|nr:Rne/Rng family ribonuclease [Bacteroidales bacterium]
MNRELIIRKHDRDIDIALLEDKLLVELHKDRTDSSFSTGDIMLGRVKKVASGLNAAFIDIGHEKSAFLLYMNLGPQVKSFLKFLKLVQDPSNKTKPSVETFNNEPDIEKTGKITNALQPNQFILVQIIKEAINTKGPRVSTEISIAGRYMVLIPFSNKVSVSQKIKNAEERDRLKILVKSIRPKNFGIIIRTCAENKMAADLYSEMESLKAKWECVVNKLSTAKPPALLVSEIDKTNVILRDILNESFNNIQVNDSSTYEEIKLFLKQIAPDKEDILKLYKSKGDIFTFFGVDKQIKSSFGKITTIKNGIYLIIEKTEALHVIDVNSGSRINNDGSQEETALAVNTEAAKEIARQLRLRDLGGIIVVDFIDMKLAAHRKQLFESLCEDMKNDKARHTVLPPTKFGLIQITRQRVRPEITIETLEKCPSCNGQGVVKPTILLENDIEDTIKYLVQNQNEKLLNLCVHPYIYAYLTKGVFSSIRKKWQKKYHIKLKLHSMPEYSFLDYRFFNSLMEEINL